MSAILRSLIPAVSVLIAPPLSADTSNKPLNVGTQVPASCSVSSETLSLQLAADRTSFDSQSTYSANINIECTGGAAPTSVTFDDGQMRGIFSNAATRPSVPSGVPGVVEHFRGMMGSSATLFYQLIASPGFSSNPNNGLTDYIKVSDDNGDADFVYTNPNWTSSNTALTVHGKLVAGVDDESNFLTPGDVPAGDYSDTVLMTVAFAVQ